MPEISQARRKTDANTHKRRRDVETPETAQTRQKADATRKREVKEERRTILHVETTEVHYCSKMNGFCQFTIIEILQKSALPMINLQYVVVKEK